MTIKAINHASIHDAGSKHPIRRIRKGAVPIVEKLAHRPQRKYVKASGHVMQTTTTGGAALRNDPVCSQRNDVLHSRSGAIPYGECPIRMGSLSLEDFPPELQDLACDMRTPMNPRGRYGEHAACPHVEHVIKLRQGLTSEKEDARKRAQESDAKRKADRDAKIVDAILERAAAADAPAEPVKAKRGRPRKQDRDQAAD